MSLFPMAAETLAMIRCHDDQGVVVQLFCLQHGY